VWERFTDKARMTMVLALQAAQARHEDYVRTEHILLALIGQDDGAASGILESLHVSLPRLRLEVERHMQSHSHIGKTGAPPTHSAKVDIEYAIEVARDLGHDAVDTGHLLFGLVRDADGLAGRILRGEGVSPDGVRQKLIEYHATQ
jgi:ATP-dependent Clp protease ATP-binding subunit ClpC